MSVMQGWKAIYARDGGWLAAEKAINAIGEVLKSRGVNFGFGGYCQATKMMKLITVQH